MRLFVTALAVLLVLTQVVAAGAPPPIVVDLEDQQEIEVNCPGGTLTGMYGPSSWAGLCEAYTPTPEPTDEPPTATPLPTMTASSTPVPPTATSVPATSTATSAVAPTPTPLTISFNDIGNPNRNLTGEYPTGVINWGTSGWWIGAAYGQFTTNSIGFMNAQTTSASLTFTTPRVLVSLRSNNVGTGSTTLTLSCVGNPNVVRTITPAQVLTITTGWTVPCSTVTFANTNAWNNDYDDLVISGVSSPTPTATVPPPTLGPSPTAGACTGTIVGAGGQSTIGAGVAVTAANGTLCIKAGTYFEQVELSKKLSFLPFGDGQVWIDGTCSNDNAFHITGSASSGSLIRGLGMRNHRAAGVKIDGAGVAGIQVDGNTIQNFDCDNSGPENEAGVAVWYGGVGERITSNVIKRRTSGALTNGLSDCIWFKSNSANPSGGGHYIAGNTLVGCWDGVGGETEDDSRGSFDRNTTIENNTITDCEDDGIQSDGGNLNNIIRNNTIRRCALGISNAPNLTGPLTIDGNVILEGRLGSYGNLACFKVGDAGTATANYTNNKCVITAPVGAGWSQTNPGMNKIVASGNQINVTNYVIELTSNAASGTSFNNDCLYTSDPTRFVKWGTTGMLNSLAAFRGVGQEAQGTSSPTCGS